MQWQKEIYKQCENQCIFQKEQKQKQIQDWIGKIINKNAHRYAWLMLVSTKGQEPNQNAVLCCAGNAKWTSNWTPKMLQGMRDELLENASKRRLKNAVGYAREADVEERNPRRRRCRCAQSKPARTELSKVAFHAELHACVWLSARLSCNRHGHHHCSVQSEWAWMGC